MNVVDTPYTSRVSLYLKVANILRSRIVKGVWRKGDRLPSIFALREEFQVGRITIRQALNLLSEEGLISSSRGSGTYVASDAIINPARDRMAAQLAEPRQTIKILDVSAPARLPNSMLGAEKAYESYICIRKLHYHHKTPYCLMDIYVTHDIFKRFPQKDLTQTALAKLVSLHTTEPVARARQTLSVGFADYDTSQILECSMAAPVAEVDRYFLDADGKLLSRGHYLYRGDLFLLETEHLGDPLSDLPSGWVPDVKIG